MKPAVAIVGMGCCYPDANSPLELWQNALAQRRSFRRFPRRRLPLDDYLSSDGDSPDRTYSGKAALIEGYAFDRLRFRISERSLRSADWTHWLALDVASRALRNAGWPEGRGVTRRSTGVILGNTLTGEFSRANTLRLRWPYIERLLKAELEELSWPRAERRDFLAKLERSYKSRFPPVNEETLAGGLANTIAGRICNHYDFQGGGYVTDGACASSLLAVANACSALVNGDLDVALAGGVDLSLDPFEMVGFAKAGALAREEMLVYDARSEGFLPGEGCGIAALMRLEDAVAQKKEVLAVIRGWGVSSDGSGGLTRPEAAGQEIALERAYRRAGFGIDTAAYFEGHGTGTPVGDATELRTLSSARLRTNPDAPPACIGSIKANIGHTKAAAGAAGLIKTVMALKAQILPPTTGCAVRHPLLRNKPVALRTLRAPEPWPEDQARRAGVSSMGFGGINVHLALEREGTSGRAWTRQETILGHSSQDFEVFPFHAKSRKGLIEKVGVLADRAPGLSCSELTDLSETLRREAEFGKVRAALVASSPNQLHERASALTDRLTEGTDEVIAVREGIFFSGRNRPPRIGFLFPGQGSPVYGDGGAWARRFSFIKDIYRRLELPAAESGHDTASAQPSIAASSLAALGMMERLGIQARLAIGHSIGELTALHWGGALEAASLLRIASARGRAMADRGDSSGAMAAVEAGVAEIKPILEGTEAVVAGLNSPRQTVVSGKQNCIDGILDRARRAGIRAVKLPVSHAFHSPLVAPAAKPLGEALEKERFSPLSRTVTSTITGKPLERKSDLPALLIRQVTSPVRFREAIESVLGEVDLWIEVGPGEVLTRLMVEHFQRPCLPLDACGDSLQGLLEVAGAAHALGVRGAAKGLPGERFAREFDLGREPRFFASPCQEDPSPSDQRPEDSPTPASPASTEARAELDPLRVFSKLVARRAQLPLSSIRPDSRLLGDLHLNSITVGRIVAEAAQAIGVAAPASPTDFATATVGEAAKGLEELPRLGDAEAQASHAGPPPGVASWVRPFTVEWLERSIPQRKPPLQDGSWSVIASQAHPLKQPLSQALEEVGGNGVVVCLGLESQCDPIGLFLQGARTLLGSERKGRFVLVHNRGEYSALARTLHLERPDLTTCVIDLPEGDPLALSRICSEIESAAGYVEARYDREGLRKEPFLCPLELGECRDCPGIASSDLLVVTGGGKGIASECALHLASRSGCRAALIGRSDPERDAELSANLKRFSAAEIDFRYLRADVTDRRRLSRCMRRLQKEWGPVTGILHAAGLNRPRLLTELSQADFRETEAPKVGGLENLLSAVDGHRLRWLITFGSIIARTGMAGEADYALANARLTRLVERWQRGHEQCRCLNVEWSLWSGLGMGQRLGKLDALRRQGISPIPPDDGVAWLERLLAKRLPSTSVVVASRFGDPPTVRLKPVEMPFLRFLEKPRVHYPEIELVAQANLSLQKDAYLKDHVFEGEHLFPAVMGLEAMAQAASALRETDTDFAFEKVRFARPVVVPAEGRLSIRVAACRNKETVEVVVRSRETGFQTNHFQARCIPAGRTRRSAPRMPPFLPALPPVSLDPSSELYGTPLFQEGRFRRVSRFRLLEARRCVAELSAEDGDGWFGPYLPPALALGDPGVRDAALHAIQACIPHAVVLPIGVERMLAGKLPRGETLLVRAQEKAQKGKVLVWDLEIADAEGRLIEQWSKVRLKALSASPRSALAPALMGPYLQRRLEETFGRERIKVAVQRNGGPAGTDGSRDAIQRALGRACEIRRGSNGRPDAVDGRRLSASHLGDLVLAVAGPGPIGCDFESVEERPKELWRDLLGPSGAALAELISSENGGGLQTACTRVWAAQESLKKASGADPACLTLSNCREDCVLLAAGKLKVATFSIGSGRRRAAVAVASTGRREQGQSEGEGY